MLGQLTFGSHCLRSRTMLQRRPIGKNTAILQSLWISTLMGSRCFVALNTLSGVGARRWCMEYIRTICSSPLCVIATASIVPGTTDKQIIDYIAWNFDVLESGVFPECGYLGASLDQARSARSLQTLAGGWFGTFHAWTGDLKEKVREHKFVRNYQATFHCEWCAGSQRGLWLRL